MSVVPYNRHTTTQKKKEACENWKPPNTPFTNPEAYIHEGKVFIDTIHAQQK